MKKLFLIVVAAIAVSCGNKQQAQQLESDSLITTTEPVVEEASPTNNAEDIDANAIEKIQEFYKNYVFGMEEVTDEVIAKYCTKKLAKKLADDYSEEYDGNGYAIWDFRSDAQDGESNVRTVTGIELLGNGVYKVKYNDNILFDTISK